MALIATGGLLLLFLFFLLPDISLAQQITAAPNLAERRVGPVLRRHEVPRRLQDDPGSSSSSVDSLSAFSYCWDNVPACSSKMDLYDACEAEYDRGDDGKYLYCPCTTSYYDMMHSCDACSVSQGVKSTSLYSVGLSLDDKDCSSRSSKHRSGGGGGTSSRSSPASGDAALTTGSGAVRSTDSAASGSEATSDSFGGLVRTSGNSAAPTAVASDSASAYANGGVRSYMLSAGIAFSLFLHQPFCE
jgi:hypothetical protein